MSDSFYLWARLLKTIGDKKKILVIGSGPTADITIPKLNLEEFAVISTNDAYTEFGSVIHVSVDAHCIEEWYGERAENEPVWVSRFADAKGDPLMQSGYPPSNKGQWNDIIPARLLGSSFIPHSGSGFTAVMIGWELARYAKGELVTVGIDLGVFWPRNGRGQFASFAMREKARVEKNKIEYQYNFGPYQTQRKKFTQFAEYHRSQPDRPRVISMSAVDWTKIPGVGRIAEALDKELIAETIQWLTNAESSKQSRQ